MACLAGAAVAGRSGSSRLNSISGASRHRRRPKENAQSAVPQWPRPLIPAQLLEAQWPSPATPAQLHRGASASRGYGPARHDPAQGVAIHHPRAPLPGRCLQMKCRSTALGPEGPAPLLSCIAARARRAAMVRLGMIRLNLDDRTGGTPSHELHAPLPGRGPALELPTGGGSGQAPQCEESPCQGSRCRWWLSGAAVAAIGAATARATNGDHSSSSGKKANPAYPAKAAAQRASTRRRSWDQVARRSSRVARRRS